MGAAAERPTATYRNLAPVVLVKAHAVKVRHVEQLAQHAVARLVLQLGPAGERVRHRALQRMTINGTTEDAGRRTKNNEKKKKRRRRMKEKKKEKMRTKIKKENKNEMIATKKKKKKKKIIAKMISRWQR